MTIQLVESKITKSKPFHSIIKTTNLKSSKPTKSSKSSSKSKSKSKSKSTQTLTIIDNGLELYQNNNNTSNNNSNQQQQQQPKLKYNNKSMIKISNPGPFTSIQPESTLIGINQKSIRGMSLVQVSQILERVPIGHDLILLARCEKDDDIQDDHDDHDIIHDGHDDPRNKRKDHDKNDKDNTSNFSTRTLTEREKNRIATGGTKYSHCCIPCGGGCCEGCGECCLCRIQ